MNSYKRFAAGSFAPTAVAWGDDNRTCSLRVVGHGPAGGSSCACAGADVNPYLALAALIAAGLHGIDKGLALEPPFEGNAYDVGQAARADARCARRATLFAASQVAREAFGEEVVEHYLNNARIELDGVRGRRHRLGARAGLRAAVKLALPGSSQRHGLRAGRVPDRVRGDAGAARHRDQARAARSPATRLPAERELCASSASRARRCARRSPRSCRAGT